MGFQILPSRIALVVLLGLAGCDRGSPRERPAADAHPAPPAGSPGAQRKPLRYAQGFSLIRSGATTIITVHDPWQGAHKDFTYLLRPRASDSGPGAGRPAPPGADTQAVPVPVARAVTLTTTDIPHLDAVGALDALVGLGGGKYVCNPAVRARLSDGRIRDVGDDMHLDLETLVALRPELLFTYVVGGSSDGGLAKLAEAHLPAAVDGSYMEEEPLGRAEWIKFTAAFFGKSAAADSVFAQVDSAYRALAALAAHAARKPTVVVGAPFGGSWWMPAGRTYVARLLADAGADYPWAGDSTHGSHSLDMEAVLAKAGQAEFWLTTADWPDLAAAKAQDPRFALFRALREGNVWNNDLGKCAAGGRGYYETGASRPDWILADLIAILHPELMPGHAFRFYRRLPAAATPATTPAAIPAGKRDKGTPKGAVPGRDPGRP
jgi:iron complex transport system substrate-binding protein